MRILNKKDIIEWHINGTEQMQEIRKCASRFEKGEKTIDNMSNRLLGEYFTNLFQVFDEDVEVRNFVYVFRGNKMGKIIIDEVYRKVKIYFCDKEWWSLLNWNPTQDGVAELGDMRIEYVGEEQKRYLPVKLINDEIYKEPEQEEFRLTEELLNQIIVLEEK